MNDINDCRLLFLNLFAVIQPLYFCCFSAFASFIGIIFESWSICWNLKIGAMAHFTLTDHSFMREKNDFSFRQRYINLMKYEQQHQLNMRRNSIRRHIYLSANVVSVWRSCFDAHFYKSIATITFKMMPFHFKIVYIACHTI